MLKKMLTLIFLTTLTLTLFQSCGSTEPDDKRKLTLTVEDVSTTEVRLRLSATEIQLPANISITKNSTFAKLITLKSNDTLFTIDSLQPSTSYSLQAIYDAVKSDPVTAVTMDTTTQNFTFETVEFGDGLSSSYFNDVWIFDENNIWAVGYIYTDTVVNANIMRWNGEKWYFEKYNGTSTGIEGIWASNDSTIYFANGAVVTYKNEIFEQLNFGYMGFTNTQGVEKLWGSSENNIWGVGPWGTIVHYDGNGWAKLDFDRQWYFYNITGSKETGIAYAVARNTSDECIIVELKNNQAKIIYTNGNTLPQLKSWTIKYSDQKLYLGGADVLSTKIWEYDLQTSEAILSKDLLEIRKNMGIRQISVNNKNDVYYIGKSDGLGRMFHFNGIRYTEFENSLILLDNSGGAYSFENLCVSVGAVNNKAYLTKIKRN